MCYTWIQDQMPKHTQNRVLFSYKFEVLACKRWIGLQKNCNLQSLVDPKCNSMLSLQMMCYTLTKDKNSKQRKIEVYFVTILKKKGVQKMNWR